ncbi:MAG: 2-succinyl-5-enolpyruvyl-6-hydroxy-3-cyclohexene-1-carboxylic-acid synthase [Eggerthellaceae bacterium]|nr:2-succinyl-5-enolpyruvyl-6-hydroxy-3-cyclohexene-1-carboxylic-acid synthase [Eggerthellaceae bacterium]
MERLYTHQQTTALFVGAFFDELTRWGVCEVVISPGSRSTALAMCAYELSRRFPERLRVYVDVDERGAAFFALGMAKAAGRPVALVCTSGTAPANYFPAVVEAATSRVPLVVLTGDRPMRLQDLGAPQTSDQLKMFGGYVRAFRQMPEPSARACDLAFARQAAREAVLAAMGPGARGLREAEAAKEGAQSIASRGCAYMAGPVHLNFPFDEPLKPDFEVEGLFEPASAPSMPGGAPVFSGYTLLDANATIPLEMMTYGRSVLILAGEGTCETAWEARAVLNWAAERKIPVLADPLSGLRGFDVPCVIDNYDNILRCDDAPLPEVVIRFGRYPVSKVASTRLAPAAVENIVVDVAETRDFNSATDVFVACTPLDFLSQEWMMPADSVQERFFDEWVSRNDVERGRILAVDAANDVDALEGAYVRKLLELIPEGSLLFSANSMPIRAIDTFMVKEGKPLAILCNRGQNGIDGTVSTALGAAQHFASTTFLTGDFTLLHDLNALALRRELDRFHGPDSGEPERTVVIVLLNNDGGAIFDMLPQASDDDYFERLFLVPQDVRFEDAARAFGVGYARAATVAGFAREYEAALGKPGISLIEVNLPLRGVRERYAPYQQ